MNWLLLLLLGLQRARRDEEGASAIEFALAFPAVATVADVLCRLVLALGL